MRKVTEIAEGAFIGASYRIDWAGVSHVGKRREVNEDSFGLFDGLLVVADGMGGHDAGDVASRVAVEAVSGWVGRVPVPVEQLDSFVDQVNADVRNQAHASGLDGMGTTLVGLVCIRNADDEGLAVVNVGDSRCYGVSSGSSELLTIDHSLVQELVEAGSLAESDVASHPERNVVTRAIGVEERVAADYVILDHGGYERFVLCSDGVSSELSAADLDALISRDAPSPEVAEAVIGAVLQGPARDNATVVVVDVEWTDQLQRVDDTGPVHLDADDTAPRPSRLALVPRVPEHPSADSTAEAVIADTPRPTQQLAAAADPPNALIDDVPDATAAANDATPEEGEDG